MHGLGAVEQGSAAIGALSELLALHGERFPTGRPLLMPGSEALELLALDLEFGNPLVGLAHDAAGIAP